MGASAKVTGLIRSGGVVQLLRIRLWSLKEDINSSSQAPAAASMSLPNELSLIQNYTGLPSLFRQVPVNEMDDSNHVS